MKKSAEVETTKLHWQTVREETERISIYINEILVRSNAHTHIFGLVDSFAKLLFIITNKRRHQRIRNKQNLHKPVDTGTTTFAPKYNWLQSSVSKKLEMRFDYLKNRRHSCE